MPSPKADDAAGLLPPECEERIFTFFTSLPAEIRLKIWRLCFVPRRVGLARHVNSPVIDIRSCGALLLVNREANTVFHEAYSYSFDTGCSDGIYFNYALDTLCFGSALISMMRVLIDEYPEIMAKIERIEAQPSDNSAEDLSSELGRMPALRLITVRWQEGTEWKHWDDNWWTIDSLMTRVNKTVGLLKLSLKLLPKAQRPILAAFFSPNEVKVAQLLPLSRPGTPGSVSLLDCRAPSKETIDAVEVGMPQEWRDHWPESNSFAEHGWVACELEIA
jgi:hypothetical protein